MGRIIYPVYYGKNGPNQQPDILLFQLLTIINHY